MLPKPVDIGDVPELLRIVEEMRDRNEPRLLRHNDEDVAILLPVKRFKGRRARRTSRSYEAFRSAAGGWKDVDTDKLLTDIYADRRTGDRPAVRL